MRLPVHTDNSTNRNTSDNTHEKIESKTSFLNVHKPPPNSTRFS